MFEDEDVIRSAEQFVTMFNRRGREGGKLRIAAGADLELSSIEIDGTGPLQITAEPGSATRRPRLRFRASTDSRKAPADWTVLFNLRADRCMSRVSTLSFLIRIRREPIAWPSREFSPALS